MRVLSHSASVGLMLGIGCCWLASCQDSRPRSAAPSQAASPADDVASQSSAAVAEKAPRAKRSGPVQLGGATAETPINDNPAANSETIVAALQPLQVWLGQWNGTSRKAIVDRPEWIWDFQTDPQQPALVLSSEKGEHLRDARLTFVPKIQAYQLTATNDEGQRRVYQGTFTEPVQDVPGDDDKLQRTFKLELTETEPLVAGELWQIVFAQQENNRYIVEINRQRGTGAFARLDTIHTQREGTSFAVSAADYGDKTCIISQGLGTIAVSYQGQSYWVCCTGCQAAFEEDPEKWIARYEEKKKMKP